MDIENEQKNTETTNDETEKAAPDTPKYDKNHNPPIVDKMCRFAFIMSTVGVLTIGICPAFGVMGIVVGAVFKNKGFELSHLNEDRIKKAFILGIVSLFLFLVDIILLLLFRPYFNK